MVHKQGEHERREIRQCMKNRIKKEISSLHPCTELAKRNGDKIVCFGFYMQTLTKSSQPTFATLMSDS